MLQCSKPGSFLWFDLCLFDYFFILVSQFAQFLAWHFLHDWPRHWICPFGLFAHCVLLKACSWIWDLWQVPFGSLIIIIKIFLLVQQRYKLFFPTIKVTTIWKDFWGGKWLFCSVWQQQKWLKNNRPKAKASSGVSDLILCGYKLSFQPIRT